MKKNKLVYIILLLMFLYFCITTLISMLSMHSIIEKDNKDLSSVVAGKVYNDINTELQSCIMVGQTMANTNSLQDLIKSEDSLSQEEMEEKMKAYLNPIVTAQGFSSAFVVSCESGAYYTQNGFNKIVAPETDEHDIWYKLFMEKDALYDFDIDIDEVNGDKWTVFLNDKIVDEQGNVIGVCGIGMEMTDMQSILSDMQEKYDIQINLVDVRGLVQMDVDDINIENRVLENIDFSERTEDYQYSESKEGYVVTKYMPNLGWYLVIQKAHKNEQQLIFSLITKNIISIIIVFLIIALITFRTVRKGSADLAESVTIESYKSLVGVYDVMCLIDLNADTIKEVGRNEGNIYHLFQDPENANQQFRQVVREIVEDDFRDRLLEVADLSTMADRMEDKKAIAFEFRAKQVGWCRVRFVAVREANLEKPSHVLLTIEVIDDEKQATEKLQRESIEAKAASEAKGKFLANMSHEIRTPINAVLGLDTMILRESTEPNIRDYAIDIKNAGSALLSLVNDILDISKIESGKMEIIEQEYELSSLLYDTVNMVRVKAQAKGLKMDLVVDEHLPEDLYGDDVRIRQVLINIMNNAVKYTETGSIKLSVSGERDGDNAVFHFSVKDTGVGIKEEDLDKLFAEFERIEEGKNRNIEGTGLGMSITIQLLDLMGSKLLVDSVYGVGSDFHFDLIQKVVSEEEIGNLQERISNRGDDYQYNASFVAPKAKVLVVDDNEINRKVFVGLLKDTRVQIAEAACGRDALRTMKKEAYDLIFLDHMMPDIDGIQVLREYDNSQNDKNANTPKIALTANAITGAKEMYIEAGFDGYLSKPIQPDKLEKMIRKLLPPEKIEVIEGDYVGTPNDRTKKEDANKKLEDFPTIEGVDYDYALLKLKDVNLIEFVIREFSVQAKGQLDELSRIYKDMKNSTEEEDLTLTCDQFRIKVHAMKSAAAMFGALDVSSVARLLELAATRYDYEFIHNLFPVLESAWLQLKEWIDQAFQIEEVQEEKPEISEELLNQYLTIVVTSLEAGNIDTADAVVKEMNRFSYGNKKHFYEEFVNAVHGIDLDKIKSIIQSWL